MQSQPLRFVKLANEAILFKTKVDSVTFNLDMKNKSCTCCYYLDKKICSHLIAASEIFNKDIGVENAEAEFFTGKNTRGRPKKAKRGGALKKSD